MSISSIVTRGFIDGVNFIPTRGYLPGSAPIPVVVVESGGLPKIFSYFPEYHAKQVEVKKAKTELQKVDSVLLEYERRRALAEESLRLAEESETQRLLKLQNELITEITRLLMVKADLMVRVRRGEEQLILMIAMRRRRLRAF